VPSPVCSTSPLPPANNHSLHPSPQHTDHGKNQRKKITDPGDSPAAEEKKPDTPEKKPDAQESKTVPEKENGEKVLSTFQRRWNPV